MPRLLFLGYGRDDTRLIGLIEGRGWTVSQTSDKVEDLSGYDLVVSFGYRHLLRADVLKTAKRPVLNLHIAYLPWNRGAHPLFWAAYDGTPVGVTIHEIDPGVDTGAICFQTAVEVDPETSSFEDGYRRLIAAVEDLFEAHLDALLSGRYTSTPQVGAGSVRRLRDLPSGFSWSDTIEPTIRRLKDAANG